MDYSKALRIVRAHRGLTVDEAAIRWEEAAQLVWGLTVQTSRPPVLIESLESGLEPSVTQMEELAMAYDVDQRTITLLAYTAEDLAAREPRLRKAHALAVASFIMSDPSASYYSLDAPEL